MKINQRDTRIAPARVCRESVKNERGIALIAALMLMIMLASLGIAVVFFSSTDVKIAKNSAESSQSFMTAEAGVADGINFLRLNPLWGPATPSVTGQWATESMGTILLGGSTGTYNIAVYDSSGSNGRLNNSTRLDKYTTLGPSDILMEVSGSVDGGISRVISVVVRAKVGAFDYAIFSEGEVKANGAGVNPGKLTGKLYGNTSINLQGNYDVSLANAESTTSITPSCGSGQFLTCDAAATQVDAPILDFAYYQTQGNFPDQQVFIMTPTVSGSTTGCGSGCETWTVPFAMQTLGTSYTYVSLVRAVDAGGGNWVNNHYWCDDPAWAPTLPANDTDPITLCPDGNAPQWWQITSGKAEDSKPFIGAHQFNAYTAPTAPYTSSIVNIFDATNHLEFIAPMAGDTATITATMLIGTAADNTTPIGKIDFEGGAGVLNLRPANGLAVVGEKVKFVAKYSPMTVNVGAPGDGAIIVATSEIKAEGKDGNAMNLTVSGSAVVGGDNLVGDDDNDNDVKIEVKGSDTYAVFNFVEVNNPPSGWINYGSMIFERREWREM